MLLVAANELTADEAAAAAVMMNNGAPETTEQPPNTEEPRTMESVSFVLEEGLRYSRENQASLKRGQLWLLPQEEEKVNFALKVLGLSSAWSFADIPGTFHPPIPLQVRKGGASGPSKKSKRKSIGSATSAPKRKSASGVRPPKERTAPLGDKETLAQKAAKASQRQLKQLPDWARRLHRIAVLLCQTEAVRPFAREPSPTDLDYSTVYDCIQPGLIPIGLSSVVSKLEQGGYQTPLETFNDIYSVWLSAYRIHQPGSPLWLQAYEASRLFQQQVANEPLRDDFTPSSGFAGSLEDDEYLRVSSSTSSRKRKAPSNADVDKLFQEFLEQHEEGPPSAAKVVEPVRRLLPNWGGFRARRRSGGGVFKRQPKISQIVQQPVTPITDQEREMFQSYLSQLEARHHLMLYEAFRRTAVWRSVESGEVELDDARTSAPVFRKMIAWCRSQLAVQLPPVKKARAEGSPPELLPSGFVGSGKVLPGVEATGGKVAAKSYLESRVPEPIHAQYSSSSQGSSTSSSDDEASSSDEDDVSGPVPNPPAGL